MVCLATIEIGIAIDSDPDIDPDPDPDPDNDNDNDNESSVAGGLRRSVPGADDQRARFSRASRSRLASM